MEATGSEENDGVTRLGASGELRLRTGVSLAREGPEAEDRCQSSL